MVQTEASGHESDGDRINANVNPTLMGDAEVKVETEAEKQAPSCGCSLTASQ